MSEFAHQAPGSSEFAAAGPRTGRIPVDLICVQCGHNLRGLLPDGRCGECGAPVLWSRAGGTAGAGDLRWLSRLRSAAETLAWTLPWAWLPLTWPLLAWALWRLGTPAPHAAHTALFPNLPRLLALLVIPAIGGGAVLLAERAAPAALPTRLYEAGLLLALLQLAVAIILVRPVEQTARGGLRLAVRATIVLALIAGVALGFAIEDTLQVIPGFAANWVGWIALGLSLVAALLLYSALLRLRHALEATVALGQAIRAELRPWQRAEPGGPGRREADRDLALLDDQPGTTSVQD